MRCTWDPLPTTRARPARRCNPTKGHGGVGAMGDGAPNDPIAVIRIRISLSPKAAVGAMPAQSDGIRVGDTVTLGIRPHDLVEHAVGTIMGQVALGRAAWQ